MNLFHIKKTQLKCAKQFSFLKLITSIIHHKMKSFRHLLNMKTVLLNSIRIYTIYIKRLSKSFIWMQNKCFLRCKLLLYFEFLSNVIGFNENSKKLYCFDSIRILKICLIWCIYTSNPVWFTRKTIFNP